MDKGGPHSTSTEYASPLPSPPSRMLNNSKVAATTGNRRLMEAPHGTSEGTKPRDNKPPACRRAGTPSWSEIEKAYTCSREKRSGPSQGPSSNTTDHGCRSKVTGRQDTEFHRRTPYDDTLGKTKKSPPSPHGTSKGTKPRE